MRDVCSVSGIIETDERGQIRSVLLNQGSILVRLLVSAFMSMLKTQAIAVELARMWVAASLN